MNETYDWHFTLFQSTATSYCSTKIRHCEKFYYFIILQWLEVDFVALFYFICLCNQTFVLYGWIWKWSSMIIQIQFLWFKCLCYIFSQAFERAMSKTSYTLEYARPFVSTWHCVRSDLQNQIHAWPRNVCLTHAQPLSLTGNLWLSSLECCMLPEIHVCCEAW